MADEIKSGLYIVTLNNDEPISVNAQDHRPSRAIAIKVTKVNCKFGKAKDLEARKRNYFKTFGKHNVNFMPIAKLKEIEIVEKAVLKNIDDKKRIVGDSGRKNEWLKDMEESELRKIVISTLEALNLEYELLPIKVSN